MRTQALPVSSFELQPPGPISLIERLLYRLGHRQQRQRWHRYLQQRFGQDFCAVDPGPIPPVKLIAKTSAMDQAGLNRQANSDLYFAGGYHIAANWFAILEHFSINPRTIGSILELGCGTARNLRHFRCIEGLRLVGSDVNPEMIDWCQQHVPGIEFYINELQPPLAFAQPDSFDLVFALSVFTHIPLEWQQSWLEEVRRVLRPGGVFLCTVVGKRHPHWNYLTREERAEYERTGRLTLTSSSPSASLSTQVGGSGWDIFQKRSEVISVFGSVFDLIDYIPGAQDVLVLAKPGGGWLPHTPYPGLAIG